MLHQMVVITQVTPDCLFKEQLIVKGFEPETATIFLLLSSLKTQGPYLVIFT